MTTISVEDLKRAKEILDSVPDSSYPRYFHYKGRMFIADGKGNIEEVKQEKLPTSNH